MFVDFNKMLRILGVITVVVTAVMVYRQDPFQHGFTAGIFLILAGVNQAFLGIYGINSFYLIYRAIICGGAPPKSAIAREQFEKSERDWPFVTVQLPIYNERFVIERLIKRCIALDYPADKLEIQVLDDSTDGTSAVVREAIARARETTDVKLMHLQRSSRANFKAGALVQGTAQARGEFLAIFDADFLPDPHFLKSTIPRFFTSKRIGCVQTRWGHLNDNDSLLTKLQAIGHDGHFVMEQFAKSHSNFTLNFNGTAGVWRRSCIIDAGDWSGDTLAEDLDLSYRAQLKGWKIDYLREIEVKAEVPISISAFKKQQARWAKGSIQTAIKLVKPVWDSETFSTLQKIQASVHLLGYSVHPLMVLNLFFTICLFFLIPAQSADMLTALVTTLLVAAGPPILVMYAQCWLGKPSNILYMPLLIMMHHGLCLSNASSVMEALQGLKGRFERTPKFGSLNANSGWGNTTYARALKAAGVPYAELLMITFLIVVMSVGFTRPDQVHTPSFPWLIFFCGGFMFLCYFHYLEHRSIKAAHKNLAAKKTKAANRMPMKKPYSSKPKYS